MTARPAVLRALTDLFCLHDDPTAEELQRYSELAFKMLADAGPSTRLYLAAKLARHPRAPQDVLELLAQSDSACAALLLQHGRNFSKDSQIDKALHANREEALALAARRQIDASVGDALIARNDPHVTRALAANPGAHVTPAGIDQLKGLRRPDRALAGQLSAKLTGPAISPEQFLEGAPEERALLIASARRSALGASPVRVRRDEILMSEVRERAIERDWIGLASALARKTSLRHDAVLQLVRDSGGEPLALLLAIVGATHSEAVRVYLCCDPPISHSYQRVRELGEIATDTPATVAGALVLAMTGMRPRISTQLASTTADDQDRAARADRPIQRTPARNAEGLRASEPTRAGAETGDRASTQSVTMRRQTR